MSKVVVQMYSLRKEFEKNAEALLRKLSDANMRYLQMDGLRGNDLYDVARLIQKYDLKVDSLHIKHNRFFEDLEGIIEECKLFNTNYVYCKYIEDEFQNNDGYKTTKEALLNASKILNAQGITVGLHSPEYDFNNIVDGEVVMDFICLDTDIIPEPDTYWLSVAQQDIMKYIEKYNNKIQTIHCKDIDTSIDLNDMKNNIRPCGDGDVNFDDLIKWGLKNNVKSFAVEQDMTKGDMFEDIQKSYQYISKLIERYSSI